jgi:hypothetical protein
MALFKKGASGNPAGRPRGSKNKSPDHIRGLVKKFIVDHWDEVVTEFSSLEGKDKMTFIDKLLKHTLPPPVNPDNLSVEQMEELISYLTKKRKDEQETIKAKTQQLN